MANDLCVAVSQSKETFTKCRIYLLENNLTKDQVLQLESSHINVLIPYYVSFIEAYGITMTEAITYFHWKHPELKYWDLLKTTIVGLFRMIEEDKVELTPY